MEAESESDTGTEIASKLIGVLERLTKPRTRKIIFDDKNEPIGVQEVDDAKEGGESDDGATGLTNRLTAILAQLSKPRTRKIIFDDNNEPIGTQELDVGDMEAEDKEEGGEEDAGATEIVDILTEVLDRLSKPRTKKIIFDDQNEPIGIQELEID
jgi:hypothetical protein